MPGKGDLSLTKTRKEGCQMRTILIVGSIAFGLRNGASIGRTYGKIPHRLNPG